MHSLRENDKDVQRFLLRIGSSLKTDLQTLSIVESRSLNYLINEAIAEYVERYLENHSD